MAKTVPDFEFRGRGRPSIYPWDEWTDGQKRVLVQGKDFDRPVDGFRAYMYAWAKRHEKKVSTSLISETELVIQFS